LGQRRIAYLSTVSTASTAPGRRFEGLKAAIKQFGQTAKLISTQRGILAHRAHTLDIEHQTGYALAKRCMKETPDVTAMVAINDMSPMESSMPSRRAGLDP
jgi:LacI family transcriptional regulator